MLLSDAHLRLALGATISSADPNASGVGFIGRNLSLAWDTLDVGWAARLTFNGGSCTLSPHTNELAPYNTPIAQVETATIVAAAGCTSTGNLSVTITSAYIGNSPLTVLVPLTIAAHTTAATIATAVRAAIIASSDDFAAPGEGLPEWYVGGTGADITLTRPLTLDGTNDDTLNIAIAAARGVSAVVDSVATTAGEAGCSIERLGADGKDLFGAALPAPTTLIAMAAIAVQGGEFTFFDDASNRLAPPLMEGDMWLMRGNGLFKSSDITEDFLISGTGILDLICLASS